MHYEISSVELRAFLKRHRLKNAQADRFAGVTPGRTDNYLSGRVRVNPAYLDALVKGAGIAESWELYDPQKPRPLEVSPVDKPERGQVYLPFAGIVPASTQWGDPLSSAEMRRVDSIHAGQGHFLAKVRGISCYPYLKEGDTVVFESDLAPPSGVIVLAQRKGDHGCTVKLLDTDPATGTPKLAPLNPETDPPDPGEGWGAIAKLVGIIRDVEGAEFNLSHQRGIRPKMIPIYTTTAEHPKSALDIARQWADKIKG